MKTGVGVFGATGYSGREVVRLLQGHPCARVAFTTGTGRGHVAHEAGLEREADAYVLALPPRRLRHLRREAARALPGGARGGPLGGPAACRRPSRTSSGTRTIIRRRALLGQAPYGLTEVFRERLRGARLVSNPGCYATSVLLPLLPLLRERLVEADDILVDAKSGASGAGPVAARGPALLRGGGRLLRLRPRPGPPPRGGDGGGAAGGSGRGGGA